MRFNTNNGYNGIVVGAAVAVVVVVTVAALSSFAHFGDVQLRLGYLYTYTFCGQTQIAIAFSRACVQVGVLIFSALKMLYDKRRQ